ncbi:MAG: DUF3089 domain-containing protein [Acidobacteriota bacterium]
MRTRLLILVLIAAMSPGAVLAAGQSAGAQPAAADPAPPSYTEETAWLCRPGRDDACAIDLTTTVVQADGTLTRETWAADPKAPIDCFYVYPTVSTDAGLNSDMTPDAAERNVIAQQFARFASKCRPFAPMYRQVTLAGLRQRLAGGGGGDFDLGGGIAYADVRAAWQDYLARDNQGRGVVLIGHSQGAFILTQLIRNEIDGKPVQQRLVSAMLLGATVPVARGRDVGGAFQHIPVCRQRTQTGCVVSFASFRSTIPPPANTLFGRAADAAHVAICTNPVTLNGDSGPLRAYLSATGRTIASSTSPQPWAAGTTIDTPFVSVPGLLTARCATNEHATYLEVTVHGDPADPRADDITGDLGLPGKPLPNWGLHLIDVNLTMGNLLDLVERQGRAWALRRP